MLAAVGSEVVGGVAAAVGTRRQERRSPVAGVVSLPRFLDLYHFGAEVGEQLPGPGSREHAAEVENTYGLQCGGHRQGLGVWCR